ncbi:hypothetical protein F7734_09605 [Scytonema sp. UIC 10036]|uniref:hypothetical protein n=1 Tax=Scytonema sp. UIC 10036 TaxID=2304196 RepID=UPI0012DACA49|nr:hypothetical protein [Scytonema sp. UIC 10036]MUG92693.1 hypothetical protein [Scytonema sp. UIC 10036]
MSNNTVIESAIEYHKPTSHHQLQKPLGNSVETLRLLKITAIHFKIGDRTVTKCPYRAKSKLLASFLV